MSTNENIFVLNCHPGGTRLVVRSTKWLPVAAVERQMSKDDPSGSLPVRRKNVLLNFSSPPSCHVGRLLIPNTFWVFFIMVGWFGIRKL